MKQSAWVGGDRIRWEREDAPYKEGVILETFFHSGHHWGDIQWDDGNISYSFVMSGPDIVYPVRNLTRQEHSIRF